MYFKKEYCCNIITWTENVWNLDNYAQLRQILTTEIRMLCGLSPPFGA